MIIEIKQNGKTYDFNLDKAIHDGYLKERREVKAGDVYQGPNGSSVTCILVKTIDFRFVLIGNGSEESFNEWRREPMTGEEFLQNYSDWKCIGNVKELVNSKIKSLRKI